MPRFTYTAVRKDGERFSGGVEAENRFDVYRVVARDGATVLSVVEEGGGGNWETWYVRINSIISRVKKDEIVVFSRNLSAMIRAGLSAARALSVMQRQTKNPKLKRILIEIENDIKKGGTLHDSLNRFPRVFSPLFVSMVRAGEESGNLADTLEHVSKQMQATSTLKKKIRGALIYPGIIISAMFGVAILMLIFIVPTLESTFDEFGVELPTSTKTIIGASNFLVNNTFLALGLLVVLIVLLVSFFRTKVGKRTLDTVIIRMPIIGTIAKETNSARTARTLSSLLSSGVEVVNALSITEEVLQNSYYKSVLISARESVQKGTPISEVFVRHERIYPPLVGEMIAVGEETGQLSSMLSQVADFYEQEVSQKTKDLSTIVEPFLMIVVGVGVGFFAVSMISPIYSLSSGI